MGSPATTSKKIAVTLLVAAAIAAVWWRLAGDDGQSITTTVANPAAQSASAPAGPAPAPSSSGTTTPASRDQVAQSSELEVAPPAEEGPLLPMFERESFGHRAGLHKAKSELALSASAALVVNQDTGEVLLRKNGEAVLPIASLTKMMTAVVITDARLPMDQPLTISEEDIDAERHSRSRLRVGTTLTRAEALQLALMSSENRAAHALGRTYPGGLPAFVRAMNRKAAALGMKSTTYVDPTGLSTGNQSTAHDLALLAAAASKNPLLAEYSTTRQRLLPVAKGRTLVYNNSNRLVKSPQWDILLQKTGYIVEAGWCMLLDTKIGEHKLLVVLLDAGGAASRIGDAEKIRRWAAAQLGVQPREPAPAARKHEPVRKKKK